METVKHQGQSSEKLIHDNGKGKEISNIFHL